MNSLTELWHREDDPDSEVDLLIFLQLDRCVASVHETGDDKLVREEPKTPFPYDGCGLDFIDDVSGTLLNNTLSEKARAEEISVLRELGDLKGVDINKGDEHKPFYRSRLVVQEYKRQADWCLFTATPPLDALRSLFICATI